MEFVLQVGDLPLPSKRGADAGKIMEKMTVGCVKMKNRNPTHNRNKGWF